MAIFTGRMVIRRTNFHCRNKDYLPVTFSGSGQFVGKKAKNQDILSIVSSGIFYTKTLLDKYLHLQYKKKTPIWPAFWEPTRLEKQKKYDYEHK